MTDAGALKVVARGDRETVMTRAFDAPRSLVFDAWTKPDLLKRWLLGPPGWVMVVCEVDLRSGGAYRFVWRRDRDGHELGTGGVYREVVRPERLVATEKFDEGWYSGEALVSTILIEQGGKTIVTSTGLYESREARDGVLTSGMESGVAASYDRLAELLAAMSSHGGGA